MQDIPHFYIVILGFAGIGVGGGGIGGNFGTDVPPDTLKHTPFIYQVIEKRDPFIYHAFEKSDPFNIFDCTKF